MSITLSELLDYAEESVKSGYKADPTASPPPLFVSVDADNNVTMMVTPWSDDNEKVEMLEMVRQMLKDRNAVSYVSVSEAWITKQVGSGKAPSECDDREEVLMLAAVNKTETMGRMLRIIREGNSVVGFEPQGQTFQMTGRLVTLLKTKEEEEKESEAFNTFRPTGTTLH